jgi:hypothetical protein
MHYIIYLILPEKSFCYNRAITAGLSGFNSENTEDTDRIKYTPGKQRKHGLI